MSKLNLQEVPFDQLSNEGFVRVSQLIPSVLPFSARTLKRLVKTEAFPAPVKIPKSRCKVFRVSEVRTWLKARNAE